MGDDFIGYKFVGDNSEFWNGLLLNLYNQEEDFSHINDSWLKENEIIFEDYDNKVW